jgi:hypothetical protein
MHEGMRMYTILGKWETVQYGWSTHCIVAVN